VALLQAHDAPLIASALAVLKTGAALVTFNLADPPERLERLRLDTTPALVLTDERHRARALAAGFPEQAIVTAQQPSGSPQHAPPVAPLDSDGLALLLCTSGSTGRPLAVTQTHRNVLHNALRHSNGLGLREDDRIALLASPSGGQGAGTVWTTLLNGATLCPFPVADRGLTGLAEWLEEVGVTVLIASASLFRHFAATLDGPRMPRVRLVRLGSEQAFSGDYESWRRHFPSACSFANMYSSSETGAIAQLVMGADEHPADGRLPAGRPAEGTEILVLDEHGVELAPGEEGEIVVRARHISPGYWGEEELTARRFATEPGGLRRFRTGDRGRFDEHGVLTVLARNDDVVKVRGNRVSLAEVETALNIAEQVAGAAVIAGESPLGEMQLLAYVVPASNAALSVGELRRELRGRLPDHAVPSAFVLMGQLPRGPHGKVDRAQLVPPGREHRPAEDADASALGGEEPVAGEPVLEEPVGELEELIAGLWARTLERPRVGRDEDFFELGGDSLAAAEVALAMHAALGVEVGLRAFAEMPTVAGLAELAQQRRASAVGSASPATGGALRARVGAEPPPASYAQERIWSLCSTPKQSAGYTLAAATSLCGPLDVDALRASIEGILRRHEALRTTFAASEGQLVQIVHPPTAVELPLHDVSAAADPATEASALLVHAAQTPFDLETGPLIRVALVRLAREEHQLQRVSHHIISDGHSWRVFVDELARGYEAHVRGEPSAVTEPALQYGDFTAWQRRRTQPGSPRHAELLSWWRELAQWEATHAPFERERIHEDASAAEARIHWGLPDEVTSALELLARESGSTHYMVRLAIFAALLSATSSAQRLLIGAYASTRGHPETRTMFGCFTHLVPLRLVCTGEPTVGAWLARVRTAVLDASEHADLPYEHAAEELAREGIALPHVRVLFAPSQLHPSRRSAGIELTPCEHSLEHYMPSGFSFMVDRDHERDGCRTDFDARLYEPARVGAFVERYQRLARELCGDPDRSLEELVRRSAG
jgi:non-ribosomal peptide synthetase component F/acyl carrier protein